MTNLGQAVPSGIQYSGSRDDSAIPTRARTNPIVPRPHSAYMPRASLQAPVGQAAPTKQTPDRYRRTASRVSDGFVTAQGSAMPSGSGMAMVGHLYTPVTSTRNKSTHNGAARRNSFYGTSAAAMDDIQLHKQRVDAEMKRYRRRSIHTLDSADYRRILTPQELIQVAEQTSRLNVSAHQQRGSEIMEVQKPPRIPAASSPSMHARNGSSDSVASSHSRSSNNSRHSSRPSSSANRNNNAPPSMTNPTSVGSENSSSKNDSARAVNVPPRGSSTDVPKRAHNPSPLSQPVTMGPDSARDDGRPATSASSSAKPSSSQAHKPGLTDSPAAKQLAAINEKGKTGKSKTSRLRRAFSFGSAADFRKAAGDEDGTKEQAKATKDNRNDDSLDEEQTRIAKEQEEGGIGNNIYGAKLFSGSTDNISVSSTASSASIMIRKMGRGMKKGTRSLVGLFRPKSIIGAPAADAKAPERTTAAVTMVTVEAERDKANVSQDPPSQNNGDSGLQHPERNSLDGVNSSERLGSSGTDNSARKSIVGGEKERAEVLAAVRKGILKKGGSSSPATRPQTGADLPDVPAISDSPNSSAPSTPNSESQAHKRSDSLAIGSEDYFMTALRLRQDTRSAPNTPQGSVRRCATFSPRIVFYDTWPSQEYDRRGEVATCNRLTPMLAQQIKEELNNFKMEMEVHENSKIYTHFF